MPRVLRCLACLSVLTLLTSAAFAQKTETTKNLPAAAADCTLQGGNIVMNCRFDTGMFGPEWVQAGDLSFSGVDPTCGQSGPNCAHMGPTNYAGLLSQILTTTPGQNYTLSFWLRNSAQPSQFQVYWGGNWISPLSRVDNVPKFAYTQFTYPVTATGTTTVLTFTFYNPPDWIDLTDVAVF